MALRMKILWDVHDTKNGRMNVVGHQGIAAFKHHQENRTPYHSLRKGSIPRYDRQAGVVQ